MSYNYFNDSYVPGEEKDDPDILEKNMLQACLPGSFLNNPYGDWPAISQCEGFMSTRCSGEWTPECDLYLNNLRKEEGVNFLNETFKRKYCLAARSKSALGCHVECDAFNQNDPDAPGICYQKGMKKNAYMTTGGNLSGGNLSEGNSNNDKLATFDKYTRNSNLDPLALVPCEKDIKCDISSADPNDPLIQKCLLWNACNVGPIIDNSSQLSSKKEKYSMSSQTKMIVNIVVPIALIVILILVLIGCYKRCKQSY